MYKYRDYAIKVTAIVLVEAAFFSLLPLLAYIIGYHPYELLSIVTAGVVVAYGVVAFFNSLSDSKDRLKLETEIQRLKTRQQRYETANTQRILMNDLEGNTSESDVDGSDYEE